MDEQLRAAERAGDDERAARLRARAGEEPLAARLTRVREKLARASAAWRQRRRPRANDPQARREDLRWFGADGPQGHNYRLAPALGERELSRLEATHGIALPADYRGFLAGIAGAGPGPSYGLLPASRWGEHLDGPREPTWALPCLLQLDGPAHEDWDEQLPDGALERYQGTLALAEEGCGYYSVLILNGPARGRVAGVSLEGGPYHVAPEPDFLSWYEAWLDRVLAGEQATA